MSSRHEVRLRKVQTQKALHVLYQKIKQNQSTKHNHIAILHIFEALVLNNEITTVLEICSS